MKYNRLSLWCAAALAFGCSAGVSGKTGSGGSGGSTASGGHGGSSSTGGTGGSNGTGGSSTGTDASLDGACGISSVHAQSVPLDLYFLMDSSKSMNDPTGAGTTKWAAVSAALDTFFKDSGSAGLGVALKYFPDEQSGAMGSCDTTNATTNCGSYGPCDYRLACIHTNTSGVVDTSTQICPNTTTTCTAAMETCQRIQNCGTSTAPCVAQGTGSCASNCSNFPGYCHLRDICTPSEYATPNVALGTLPGAESGLNTSLMGHAPDGYTPTGPALGGAVMWAEQQQSSNPAHKVAIVLVTDGLPGGFIPGFPPAECAPSDIPGIATILSGAASGTNQILTFVVGIFNPASAEGQMAPSNLKSLAQAGGTDDAVIIDVTGNTVTQQLDDALAKAQTKAIACSYAIPPSTGGIGVDFNKVNVQFSGSAGSTTVGHTGSSSACDKGGWYYDVDPSAGTPTKIIACPSTCTQFNADVSGHVDIVLGCATISVG